MEISVFSIDDLVQLICFLIDHNICNFKVTEHIVEDIYNMQSVTYTVNVKEFKYEL